MSKFLVKISVWKITVFIAFYIHLCTSEQLQSNKWIDSEFTILVSELYQWGFS